MHLYVHVPFCARRCSYCDFAIAVRRVVPSNRFREAVIQEWQGLEEHPAWETSPRLRTIYFGGGTPSRLAPDQLGALIQRFREDRGLIDGAEVTIEANPEDVTADSVASWVQGGVNRVSLGVQSFDPRVLDWMHRTHTTSQVGTAMALLRLGGISSVSLDLIYGLPSELERNLVDDLDRALALGPEHLSVYGLTVERGTPLARWVARQATALPSEIRSADEFLMTHERLTRAGFDHYEVSNYSRPGCRAMHNSAYWSRAPFLGLGPSAHSGTDRTRWWNVREWAPYLRQLESRGVAIEGCEELTAEAVSLETLYLGLRTSSGVPAGLIPGAISERWRHQGWCTIEEERVKLLPEGWLRLDALVTQVLDP